MLRRPFTVCVAILILVAGACGDGDSGDPASDATDAPAATSDGDLAAVEIELTTVAELDRPIDMAYRTGDDSLYIAEKGGRIKRLDDGELTDTVLDISSEVSSGNEQGLLGIVFSPEGSEIYVNFTDTAGDTVVREYAFDVAASDPRDLLQIDQPYGNHNGGDLEFGPDNYLYISTGDGGSGGDPEGNAQNLDSLLGKLLRIDPSASGDDAYSSPDDNPFVGEGGRDEIWAYGLRNPWRISFDRETDDLWIGDVGQSAYEEIDLEQAGSDGGENYGWNPMEGTRPYKGGAPPANHHPPIYEYSHDDGNCSVTGGYVYRGSEIPELVGAYVFADFCVGRLRAFVNNDGKAEGHRFLGPEVGNLASFGEDADGELYVLSLSGTLSRIDPA